MTKYAVFANMDLDIDLLESTQTKEVEKITENVLRILVDNKRGCKIKNLGIKVLGKAERFNG